MENEPFTFPLWVVVNVDLGQPYKLLGTGVAHTDVNETPIPSSAIVFTTKNKVPKIGFQRPPFVAVEMDRDTFYDALKRCRYIENVVIDMGNPDAVTVRIEQIPSKFRPDLAS